MAGKAALAPADGKAFFTYAKANADKLTVAHAGVGSNSHLCAVLLSQALSAKFAQVAYRGTGPAMNDLVAGQVDILCDQSTTAVPQIESKKIKAFAVTSPDRLDVLKDTPTTAELAVKLDMTDLARPLRAEGHAGRRARQAQRRLARGAGGQDRDRTLPGGRHQALPAGRMDARGAWRPASRRRSTNGRRP
ncbi:tripartite tricarboxylate transporter substrate-binding protein, partial [Bosea thiooxidans]